MEKKKFTVETFDLGKQISDNARYCRLNEGSDTSVKQTRKIKKYELRK